MDKYHENYRFVIVAAAISGLYLSSVEKIFARKWITTVFKCLPVIPCIFLLVFIASQFKYMFFDEGDLSEKLLSSLNVSFSCLSALVFCSFYWERRKIVDLWEWWDKAYADDPFPLDRRILFKKSVDMTIKRIKIFLPASLSPIFVYIVMSYFNKEKSLGYPSGIPYRNQSPDFELLITFDLAVGVFKFLVLQCHEAVIMVFLSMEKAELLHLKRSLGRIFDVISTKEFDNFNSEMGLEHGEIDNSFSFPISGQFLKRCIIAIAGNHLMKFVAIFEYGSNITRKCFRRFHERVQKIFEKSIFTKGIVFLYILCVSSFLSAAKILGPRLVAVSVGYWATNFLICYMNLRCADEITDTVLSSGYKYFAFLFQVIKVKP